MLQILGNNRLTLGLDNVKYISVIHKLRLQEKVDRWSKNINFYKVETVNKGGRWSKKGSKTQFVSGLTQ